LPDIFAFLTAIDHKSMNNWNAGCCRWMRRRGLVEGKMLALRLAGWVWAAVIMAIMWLPEADFGGLDLSSPTVQGASFAVGAVLLALADRRRPYFFRRQRNSQSPLGYLVVRFRRHLIRITVMLICYAAALEIGQYFTVDRSFRLAQLALNIGWILLACTTLYVLARIFLVGSYLGRITQQHLGRMSAAFRGEVMYSARLRDISQAAYSVCLTPSLSAEDKVDRVRRLLDKALGAEMPNHNEELLDTVFGARNAQPVHRRPSVDHGASPVERNQQVDQQ
jgi:hypothetical protein